MKPSIAWITGASGGIGSAIGRTLAKDGMDIAASYYKNRQSAEQLMLECQAFGVRSTCVPIDLMDRSSVEQAYEQIRWELGKPNILIHAAGQLQVGLLQDFSESDFQEVMGVHVGGAFRFVQMGLPHMISEKWGRILFLSSIWGEVGGAGEVLYSAAKGALNSMSKALAKELAPSGITVNAIAPGVIATTMTDQQLSPQEQMEIKEFIPMQRLGRTKEVAGLARFLVSEEASYITGQVVNVDGGFS